jgi:hypothetical protein
MRIEPWERRGITRPATAAMREADRLLARRTDTRRDGLDAATDFFGMVVVVTAAATSADAALVSVGGCAGATIGESPDEPVGGATPTTVVVVVDVVVVDVVVVDVVVVVVVVPIASPLIFRGEDERPRSPIPNCPYELEPQHQTSSVSVTAQA